MDKRRKGKGFLGPIGDDLPSLIPLLFALTMFFYVFTFTWNIFDTRDETFSNDLSVLRISSALRGNNYIASAGKFGERCETAKAVQRMRFLSGLLELSTSKGQSFEGIDIEKISSGEQEFLEEFECSNTDELPDVENRTPIVRYFPVALEEHGDNSMFYVKPMLLVVVAWR